MKRSQKLVGGVTSGLAMTLLSVSGCRDTPPPAASRTDPVPRKVLLEIDRMTGTPPLQLDQVLNGTTVSLKSIYADVGIQLDVRQNQVDLPRQAEVGLADLHAMMTAFRSVPVPPDTMGVHALVLSQLRDEADTLGVMFDFGDADADARPREGFAIFADPHATLAGGVAPELLLTLAHELAHCFNLHHPDWEGEAFRRGSTIESYSQADSVRWTLSNHSKAHIRSDPEREVWPGRNSIGFGLVTQDHLARHNAAPSETFRVVEPGSFSTRRPDAVLASALRKAAQRDRTRFLPADRHAVKLQLETPKQSYAIGEQVMLTVGLHNAGTTNQSVYPLLEPRFRFLNVEFRRSDDTEFETFQPVLLADARGIQPRVLAPGESIHAEAPIFFGADGWVFKTPGEYLVRADYAAPVEPGRAVDATDRLTSGELKIVITEPATSAARRVTEVVLGHQEGLFLVLGGGDHLKNAAKNLKQVLEDAPQAPQAAGVRLALGSAALHPTVDPVTGVQSQPRLDEAVQYLGTTLNSQLSALSVVKAQVNLADALEDNGRRSEATRVRNQTVQKLQRQESAKEYIDEIKARTKTQRAPIRPSGVPR